MDDHEVVTVVGCSAVVVALLATAWLVVRPDPGPSPGHIRTSEELSAGSSARPHQEALDQLQRCVDADKALELTPRRAASGTDRTLSRCATRVLAARGGHLSPGQPISRSLPFSSELPAAPGAASFSGPSSSSPFTPTRSTPPSPSLSASLSSSPSPSPSRPTRSPSPSAPPPSSSAPPPSSSAPPPSSSAPPPPPSSAPPSGSQNSR